MARATAHALALAATVAVWVAVVVPLSRVRAAVRRRRGGLPTVLWGTTPVINLRYSVLADRLYGYDSHSLVYRVYDINRRSDFDYVLDRWAEIPVVGRLVAYGALLWAGLRYDIFGCFFDGALLAETPYWHVEPPLLRLAGKKILVYPYGGDARLPSAARAEDRWNVYLDVPPGEEERSDHDVERRLRTFGRWANVVLGNNDLVDLPRCRGVLPYPFDTSGWEPEAEAPDDDVVTVVHAANHRHYKGTRFLVDAVDRLRAEGLPVELVVVEKVPNDAARDLYRQADIVAADFLTGGFAYFAIEGMALGKPVISYLRPSVVRRHPEWRDCPVVDARPDELVDVLRRLVLDPELRRTLGARGPEYVRRVHSLEAVGSQLDGIYRRLWRPRLTRERRVR